MHITIKTKLLLAVSLPLLVLAACTCITFLPVFAAHPDKLSTAIVLDLAITAPLLYYFVIRKTAVAKITVLRVFILGVLAATLLLSGGHSTLLHFIKTWISPVIEGSIIFFIVKKFYAASKAAKAANTGSPDFLTHCRAILQSVLGNEKAAHVLAAEVAVFYYAFSPKAKGIDNITRFTIYKESGSALVLGTFLGLFVIETAGMHFLFLLWSKTAAIVLTTLSFYTCLQLFAHIKALRNRAVVIANDQLLLRNGIMGGDAVIDVSLIEKVERTTRTVTGEAVVKLALIKGLESHNLAIYLSQPVTVTKAFGIKKKANIILVYIDKPEAFISGLAKVDRC